MVRLTLRERRHVAALQAKLGEGGDLAEDRVGPLVFGQCIAEPHVQVHKGGQMPKAFGYHISKIRNKNVKSSGTHFLGATPGLRTYTG